MAGVTGSFQSGMNITNMSAPSDSEESFRVTDYGLTIKVIVWNVFPCFDQ